MAYTSADIFASTYSYPGAKVSRRYPKQGDGMAKTVADMFSFDQEPEKLMGYRECSIPKKNGKARKIVMPERGLLRYQRKQLLALTSYYNSQVANTTVEKVAHGFITGRNVITAAEQHVGYKATIMMDIENFFDSVTRQMLPQQFQDDRYYHKAGYCAQGFATSPMLANIATIGLINDIQDALGKLHKDFAFTIYADDLQISVNTTDKKKLAKTVQAISEQVEKAKFKINAKKTRIKYAKYGFRRILGVNVGDKEVRATRKTMRKIRAARHQENRSSLGGLINWSNCNLPKNK